MGVVSFLTHFFMSIMSTCNYKFDRIDDISFYFYILEVNIYMVINKTNTAVLIIYF